MRSNPPYYSALDGLRALAVGAVVLFHLGIPGFSLGWVGVNLFFVISGFLITGILLDAKATPHYFRNFYVRRALRIFPIYYLVLCLLIVYSWLAHIDMRDVGYYFVYLQNILFGLTGLTQHFTVAFNHTWSLAVEEQFYLMYPVIVLWLRRRALIALLLCCVVAAPLLRLLGGVFLSRFIISSVWLPMQVDALAMGALLAVAAQSPKLAALATRRLVLTTLALSGIALAILIGIVGSRNHWSLVVLSHDRVYPEMNSLLALFFAALVASASIAPLPFSRWLAIRPLRHIGKISYGIYLYHFPILVLLAPLAAALLPAGTGLALKGLFALSELVLIYLVAMLSWRVIESPFLGLKQRLGGSPQFKQTLLIPSTEPTP